MSKLASTFVSLMVATVVCVGAAHAQRAYGYISVGRTVRDSIASSDADLLGYGRARVFRFEAVQGQGVSVNLRPTGFVPSLMIGRQVGVAFTHYLAVPEAWDSVAGFHFEPTVSAAHFLVVLAKDVVPPARFEVSMHLTPRPISPAQAKASEACMAGATTCAVPAAVEGMLTARSPVDQEIDARYDFYSFDARKGEQIGVFLESTAFDTYLSVGTLQRGLFEEIASDDDGGKGYNSQLIFTAPADAEYVARVAGTGILEYGAYRIRLGGIEEAAATSNLTDTDATVATCRTEGVNGWSPWAACERSNGEQRLTANSEVQAVLPADSITTRWLYSGRAGSTVTVVLSASYSNGALAIDRIRNGRFEELKRQDIGTASTNAPAGIDRQVRVSLEVPETGDYVVRIASPRAASKRRYRLSVSERMPRPASPQRRALRADVDVQGILDGTDAALADKSPYEEWTVDAVQGQQLVVTMRSTAFDPVLTLGELDAKGSFVPLATNDDAVGGNSKDARLVVTPRKRGRFIIRANTFGPDQSGSYAIRIWPSVAALDSARLGAASAKVYLDSLNRAVSAFESRARALFAADSIAAAADAGQRRVAGWREIFAQGVTETSRNGLARALGSLSWYMLFGRRPAEALAAAEEGLRTSPLEEWIETNRAHALLLLGRTSEAAIVYGEYRGKVVDGRPWEQTIRADLAELEAKGVFTRAQAQLVEGWLANQPATAEPLWDAKAIVGRWVGSYTCAQGETALVLTLSAKTLGKVEALFEFSPAPSNPNVPAGSYRMKGWHTQNGQLELVGTEWVDRPGDSWSMVGLSGRFHQEQQLIQGTVPECRDVFTLRRRVSAPGSGQ